jgi:hypothetical protein
MLSSLPLWLIFAVTLFILVFTAEFGRRLGLRFSSSDNANIDVLEGAVLGLLALMIGFTFAMALARHDARREAVIAEANAIGTTALRARLLPSPMGDEVHKLLRSYIQLRLESPREPSAAALAELVGRSNELQEQLWQIAGKAKTVDPGMVPTGLFIQSLNELIDVQTVRVAQFNNRVPDIVFVVLYGITFVAIAFAGYGAGLTGRSRPRPVLLVAVVICLAIWLIQDLDRPPDFCARIYSRCET